MFSIMGSNVQGAQSLFSTSHFVSVLTSNINILHQVSVREFGRSWRKQHKKPTEHKPNEAAMVEAQLQDLGLEHLEKDIDIRVLCPILSTNNTRTRDRHSHWKPHNVSTHSYFENQHGFSEAKLHETPTLQRNLTVDLASLRTRWIPKSILFQQTRGFKSRRVKDDRRKDPDMSMQLRETLFGKSPESPSKDHTSKMRTLLSESEQNQAVQDKLKIAFAEGYTANSGDDKKNKKFLGISFGWWWTLVIVGFLLYTARELMKSVSKELKFNVVSGDKFEIDPEQINVTFEDVKGADEAKEELQDIVEFLKDPEKFKALGAKLPKGVLLVGMPGIGKTLLARAVAGEAAVPFFHASGSEFDEVFVGTGARRVRSLFSSAKARAPCVVFLDEIDTVGAKRSNSQLHPYANQTINQLLSEMDGFHQNQGIIVLGATNKRDNLDKALLRPGRFDVEINVVPPDLKGRREILQLYLNKVRLGDDINLDLLAKATIGCTGADLENIVNQAAIKAALDSCEEVTMAHLLFAKDKIRMGPAKKHRIPDEDQNLNTAYHEAGHTLVAYFTKHAQPVEKVTIIQRGRSLGHTLTTPQNEYNKTKVELLADLDVAMGGRVAEEIAFGTDKVTTGASSDFQSATMIATEMVKHFGMSDKVGVRIVDLPDGRMSNSTREQVDQEVKRLLQESYERARTLLKSHSAELHALSQALMKHETLDSNEIKVIMEGKQLDKS